MNISEMKKYIDKFMEYISRRSCLILDQASSHTSKEVRRYIESFRLPDKTQAVIIKLLKPKTSFIASPLDMGAIAEFKRYFYKFDRRTLDLKIRASHHAWQLVSNDNLQSYIHNCGYCTNESLDSIRGRFMKEVRAGIPEKFKELWEFYDGWASGAYTVHGVSVPRGVPLEQPKQLDANYLDGQYWTLYGSHVKQ